ncbi:MAG: Ig-like domain-containing protein, partial [Candidatus Krumholzibacteria bacterium]
MGGTRMTRQSRVIPQNKAYTLARDRKLKLVSVSLATMWLFVAGGCGGDDPPPTLAPLNVPPQIISVFPADGATGVPVNTIVSVTFNENIRASSVTTTTFRVSSLNGTVSVSGKTATYTPDAPLDPGITYTATITDDVKDLGGASLEADSSWSFTASSLPVASAGPDQDKSKAEPFQLDGSASLDPDGDPVTYSWNQIFGPTVTLSDPSAANPSVFDTPDMVTTLEFELTVNNGLEESEPDTVVIWILEDGANALWVSKTGNDANAGTREAPLASVQEAINNSSNGADVYVADGVYAETITLRTDVSIYGGFSTATWLRDIQQNQTFIIGGPTAVRGSSANNLTLDGLTIESADGVTAGESSTVIGLSASTGVVISRNTLIAGVGADGANGSSGADGAKGSNGSKGEDGGFCSVSGGGGDGGASSIGRAGGKGGNGGNSFGGGLRGSDGQGPGGGLGGAGGTGGGVGKDGSPGGAGSKGAAGSGGLAFGSLGSGKYNTANGGKGATGIHGSGGGGGGGGSAASLFVCGGGGGGGGAGGAGGEGGLGAGGGGGSFGILLTNASEAVITDNAITTDGGGT